MARDITQDGTTAEVRSAAPGRKPRVKRSSRDADRLPGMRVRYKPMSRFEAQQRQRPLSERSLHADDNLCVEVPFAARAIAKQYEGSNAFMVTMRKRSENPAWVPSWKTSQRIIATAREFQQATP